MCRYPLGSGGNRVATRPPHMPVLISSSMIWRMKLLGAEAASRGPGDDMDGLLDKNRRGAHCNRCSIPTLRTSPLHYEISAHRHRAFGNPHGRWGSSHRRLSTLIVDNHVGNLYI